MSNTAFGCTTLEKPKHSLIFFNMGGDISTHKLISKDCLYITSGQRFTDKPTTYVCMYMHM